MITKKPNRHVKPVFKHLRDIDRHKRYLLGLPIFRSRAEIPWGYDLAKDNDKLLLPDVNAIRLLLKAKLYLKTSSLKSVAIWLSEATKRPISSEGLRLILIEKCPFPEVLLNNHDREQLYRNPHWCDTAPASYSEIEQQESELEFSRYSDEAADGSYEEAGKSAESGEGREEEIKESTGDTESTDAA